jgi:uncharacterized protein YjgD (DUF1641 family)
METLTLQNQLDSIQDSLDEINKTLALQQQRQLAWSELQQDLNHLARDVFRSLTSELEEIEPEIKHGEAILLLKTILRNIPNIRKLLEQLESAQELITDGAPLARDIFQELIKYFDLFEKRGYFDFLRELMRVGHQVMTHFSPEDVSLLADNIVTILETIKSLTQPEMLSALNNGVNIYRNLGTKNIEEYSLWKAFRELNSPELKRGIGFMMAFLKNIAQENGHNKSQIQEQHHDDT